MLLGIDFEQDCKIFDSKTYLNFNKTYTNEKDTHHFYAFFLELERIRSERGIYFFQ
ncbi:MAG: hypothetical protein ACJAWV_004239 [Flammeovirgaceae bacterium]|jgi:hypothetical protein